MEFVPNYHFLIHANLENKVHSLIFSDFFYFCCFPLNYLGLFLTDAKVPQ